MLEASISKRVFFFTCYCALLIFIQFRIGDILRTLSVYLGDGKCYWTPPTYDVAPNDYFQTLVTGFPGGSKRISYAYIEAMTGIAFNDEWPLPSNDPDRPFTKGNYPHHEGIWGVYGNKLNQVILLMRNPMAAIVEYHDVLHDLDYAHDLQTASQKSENLYLEKPTVESWREWRDLRLPAEIHWYGWFIDYWMENGLLRDIPSHKLATREYWLKMYVTPGPYYESGQAFMYYVGDADVTEEYDQRCINDMPNGSCEPVLVISEEKLVDDEYGPVEMVKLANVLENKHGIDLINHEAFPCLWDEMMVHKKGIRTMMDRNGSEDDYKFKLPHLTEMLSELNRLKTKYSGPAWSTKETAQDLVKILNSYITNINSQIEFGNYE